MKKLTIAIICSLFLIGIVFAGIGISNIDKTIKLTTKEKDALTSIGLGDYLVRDITKGTNEIERCLYKPNAINTCERFLTYYIDSKNNTVYYSSAELLSIMNTWEKLRMKHIANMTINEISKPNEKKIREGITTITDR